MRPTDAAFVVAVHEMPHAAQYLNAPTEELVIQTLADPARLSLILESDDRPVGMMLVGLTAPWLLELQQLAIGEPGHGFGREAIRWLLREAFERRGAHRLWLEVRADNAPAIALYERCGFRHEGTWRDGYRHARNGTYHDLRAYGVLEGEYRASTT